MTATSVIEQRRFKRFSLKLPVRLLRCGDEELSGSGETRNLSSGGVLFTSDVPVAMGEAIEYEVCLSEEDAHVLLHCLGKVTRIRHCPSDPGHFEIAATLERYEFVREAR